MAAKTLFEKIWDAHVVRTEPDGTTLLYVDRQLVHEVTSPQAFEGLKLAGRKPRRPGATLAVPDHNVPTTDRKLGIGDPVSAKQMRPLEENCRGVATQCLLQTKPKTMEIRVDGTLSERCSAKDVILAIIGKIGTAGGTGYVIEYTGSAIRALSMEGRMTLCNMSIEGGARAGMVAPDENTIAYIKARPCAP